MRVVFIGLPGVGKGTQCKRISDANGVPHVSTGEMLRIAKEESRDQGDYIASRIDDGQLVSDEFIGAMLWQRLEQPDCHHGFVLDGYPRTSIQAGHLDDWLERRNLSLTAVIHLQVDLDVATKRIEARSRDTSRADDRIKVIGERMQIYQSLTAPVLDFYRRDGRLLTVDASGTIDEVTEMISKKILS